MYYNIYLYHSSVHPVVCINLLSRLMEDPVRQTGMWAVQHVKDAWWPVLEESNNAIQILH